MSIAPLARPENLLRLAFVFALAGYGTKIGLVPFHTWLPDAHSQAPSPVSALLSGVSLDSPRSTLWSASISSRRPGSAPSSRRTCLSPSAC